MTIDTNPQAFLNFIQKNEEVVFNEKDQWSSPDLIEKYLFRFRIATPEKIAEKLVSSIDHFEIQGEWRTDPSEPLDQKMQQYIRCAKWVGKKLSNPELKAELKLRIHALRMRLPPLETPKKEPESKYKELKLYAKKWAEMRWNVQEKELTKAQKKQLKELKKHPKLTRQLAASEALFRRFASWSLTYQCGQENSVDIFRKYPGLTQFLMKAELHKSIGYHGGLTLEADTVMLRARLEKEETRTLVQGKIDLLNAKATYFFKNQYERTTAQILENFEKHNHRWDIRDTHFVYEGDGVENFNPYQHGSWDPAAKTWKKIDFTQKDFYKHFPKVNKKYKKQDLESTYNVELKKGHWLFVLEAGRDNSLLDPSNSHAWIKIYQPMAYNQYKLLVAFSQSAKENNNSAAKKAKLFMNTVAAGVCIHEPRIYDQEQQFRGVGFNITPKNGKNLLMKLQEFLQKEEKGHLHYQVVGNNCFQSMIDFSKDFLGAENFVKKCPEDDLKIHVLDFYVPLKLSQRLNQFIKKKGGVVERVCLSIFGTLCGQHRSMKSGDQEISVSTHSTFASERKIYAPQKFIGLGPTQFI